MLRAICAAGILISTLAAAADTFYVSVNTGNDAWDGRCSDWNGATCGPKKTIWGAIRASHPNDEIVVADGRYTGRGNRQIAFRMR